MESVSQAILRVRQGLEVAQCDSPELEADILVAAALGVSRSQLLAIRSSNLDSEQLNSINSMLERRSSREPLAYITGSTEFYGHVFETTPGVLIPRVDTEALIDVTLKHLGERNIDRPTILDLGVGSGCIICTLLAEIPQAQGIAVDFHPTPLKLAARNAETLGVQGRMTLLHGSWYDSLTSTDEGRFDLIVSNPPYVRDADREALDPEVRDHEPAEALFMPGDALENFQIILAGAKKWLKENGALILEMGHDQAEAVSTLATNAGYAEVTTHLDTAGISRVLVALNK